MTQVIAIHAVLRQSKAGKLEEIAPGQAFDSDGDELKHLLDAGAVRPSKKETGTTVTSQEPEPEADDTPAEEQAPEEPAKPKRGRKAKAGKGDDSELL